MANMAQSSSSEYLEIPGYRFWIEIAGKKAKHYQVNEDNNVVSCYIASEVNQEFRIFSQKHQEGYDARAKFYINDDIVDTHLFKPKSENEDNTYRLSRIKTERGKQRFAFTNIDYADDEHPRLSTAPENLGTIRIDMFRVKNIRRVPGSVSKTFGLRDVSTMSEKSKSIGFQTISLRPPEARSTDRSHDFIYVFDYADNSSNRSPWYTIKFFYRTLDILRAQGIAFSPASFQSNTDDRQKHYDSDQGSDAISVSQGIVLTPERKPLITPKTDRTRMMKAMEAIVIADSDSEDDESFLRSRSSQAKTEQFESPKRSRESCVIPTTPRKRIKKSPDSAAIVIDSD